MSKNKKPTIICRNSYNVLLAFQFSDDDVPNMQCTLAILMTYINGKDVEDGTEDLMTFVNAPENKEWLEKLTSFLCKWFDKTHKRFMKNIPFAALDVCGITIWARCYRRHVGIVFNTSFWCTSREQDLQKCDVILVYRGSNSFENTRVLTMDEFNTMSDKVGRIQALMDEKELSSNVSNMVKKRAKQYRKKVDRIDSEDEESDLDLEATLEEGQPVQKPKKQRKTRGALDLTITTRFRSHNKQKSPEAVEAKKETENNMQNEPPVPTEESGTNNMQKCSVVITQQDLRAAMAQVE